MNMYVYTQCILSDTYVCVHNQVILTANMVTATKENAIAIMDTLEKHAKQVIYIHT